MRLPRVVLCAVLAASSWAKPADAQVQPKPRELYWKALDVSARLDAEGVLHVRERHHVVMTGDWNGGERGFRLAYGQEIELDGVTRVDPQSGARRPLARGSLGAVDQFAWTDERTLRWRSRSAGDPPFDGTELIHELDYRLSGVVVSKGPSYELAHDFAFADRVGTILSHTVELTIDEPWTVDGPRTRRVAAGALPPGRGHVIRLALGWAWTTPPTGVSSASGPAPWLPPAVLGAVAALFLYFLLREFLRGRFAWADARAAEAPGWLEAHLLSYRAEEVSALWYDAVGAPQVAAAIARFAGEGKMRTRVSSEGKDLTVTILVGRDAFEGYERTLVDALFPRDWTESSGSMLSHYHKGSFNLAKHLRPGLPDRVASLVGPRRPAWTFFVLPSFLFAAAVAFVVSADGSANDRTALFFRVAFGGFLAGLPALFGAGLWRRRPHWGLGRGALALSPSLALAWIAWSFAGDPRWLAQLVSGIGAGTSAGYGAAAQLAAVCMSLGMLSAVLGVASTRARRASRHVRRAFLSARRYLLRELAREQPRLRDEWFPYVVALGLDKASGKWFRQHGAGVSSTHDGLSRGGSGASGGSSSSGPSGWTGGGGSFGGAGATASWGAAAAGLSGGSSSSGSGSSGSSGGSSSGGGGGGGW